MVAQQHAPTVETPRQVLARELDVLVEMIKSQKIREIQETQLGLLQASTISGFGDWLILRIWDRHRHHGSARCFPLMVPRKGFA